MLKHGFGLIAVLALLAGAVRAAEPEVLAAHGIAELEELSGLAPSLSVPGVWWGVNDSGNAAELIAFDEQGATLARVAVTGARNFDWEDLASFERDGMSWLAIADCGDNFELRREAVVYLVPEPLLDQSVTLPAQRVAYTYPEGSRDCEALAADPRAGELLLMDKGRQPPRLYSISMLAWTRQPARLLAEAPHTWPHEAARRLVRPIAARWRGSPTAMDLSRDGSRLLVLTLTHALIFERHGEEPWRDTLARDPQALRLPLDELVQAEAAAFAADGRSVLIGGEAHAPLFRWRLP